MLKLEKLRKHTQYNFFPETYNLYGPHVFKVTYAHISSLHRRNYKK